MKFEVSVSIQGRFCLEDKFKHKCRSSQSIVLHLKKALCEHMCKLCVSLKAVFFPCQLSLSTCSMGVT